MLPRADTGDIVLDRGVDEAERLPLPPADADSGREGDDDGEFD